MTTLRSASDVVRDAIRSPSSVSCACSFLFGAVVTAPLWLVLAGELVRGLQVSLLLASAVALLAASSPWWVDAIEQREIDRVLAQRRRAEQ